MILLLLLCFSNCLSILFYSEPIISTGSTENATTPVRIKEIVRHLKPNITNITTTGAHYITTDNYMNASAIRDTYALNQDMIWQFHIPQGCRMVVVFTKFELEISDKCKSDSFSVQTSKDQQEIYRYCNDPRRIEIKNRKRVQMTFKSDDAVAMGGFKANVCIENIPDDDDDGHHDDISSVCNCTPTKRRNRRRRRRKRDNSSPTSKPATKSKVRFLTCF